MATTTKGGASKPDGAAPRLKAKAPPRSLRPQCWHVLRYFLFAAAAVGEEDATSAAAAGAGAAGAPDEAAAAAAAEELAALDVPTARRAELLLQASFVSWLLEDNKAMGLKNALR